MENGLSQKLITGISIIDKQHTMLLDTIKKINPQSKLTGEEYNKTIEFLCAYTLFHFSAEEKLMEESGFPGTEEHEEEHRSFIRDLKEKFGAALYPDTPERTLELQNWLTFWLVSHIMKKDMALAEFLLKADTK